MRGRRLRDGLPPQSRTPMGARPRRAASTLTLQVRTNERSSKPHADINCVRSIAGIDADEREVRHLRQVAGEPAFTRTPPHGDQKFCLGSASERTISPPSPGLSITHIFSGALRLVNLGQFCDLANPHQDSFGNGAHDLTQYCLGPSSGFGG